MTRRDYLQIVAAASAAAAATPARAAAGDADREARLKWWHDARFSMFIHWGLYSQLGRHEWAMEVEGIPVEEYQKLAASFHPKPNAARDWARLVKQAGQKYMVMTTKHHEGFCNFDSKLTDYCAPKQGPGRAGPPPLRGLHPRPDPRTAHQLRQDRRALVRRQLAAQRRRLGIGKNERHGVSTSARDPGQQPQRSSGRFHHPGTEHPRFDRRGVGVLHDHERELGLSPGRHRLENAPDHRAQPGHVRSE